jgi:hypothetical protein
MFNLICPVPLIASSLEQEKRPKVNSAMIAPVSPNNFLIVL